MKWHEISINLTYESRGEKTNLAFQALHPKSLHPHQFTNPVSGGKLKVFSYLGQHLRLVWSPPCCCPVRRKCPQSQYWPAEHRPYPVPKREFPAASAAGDPHHTGRELEPQWKAGTLGNIIELFLLIYYLIQKGNIDWELEAETGQTVLPHSAAKQGCGELVPPVETSIPAGLCNHWDSPQQPATAPFHKSTTGFQRSSESAFTSSAHGSTAPPQLSTCLGDWWEWWTEEHSPKQLNISSVFFSFYPSPVFFPLLAAAYR